MQNAVSIQRKVVRDFLGGLTAKRHHRDATNELRHHWFDLSGGAAVVVVEQSTG
jgi:hypothetical protein